MTNDEIKRLLGLMKGKFPNAPGFRDDPKMTGKERIELKRTRLNMVKTFSDVLADCRFCDVEQALHRWCARCRFVPSANELRKETELFLDEITLRERSFATLGMEYTGVGSRAWREKKEKEYHNDQNRTG